MSFTLVLFVFLVGGLLGLWGGCRYGCGWITECFKQLWSFLRRIIIGILVIIAICIFVIVAVIWAIIWFVAHCIDYLIKLPWRRWWESLRWLWWLLGGLLFLIAAILALLGSLPAAIGLALLAGFLWLALLGLFVSIIMMVLGVLAWFTGLLQEMIKWIAAFLAGLSLTIPDCSNAPSPPARPLVAAPAPAPVSLPPIKEEKTCTIVPIEKGDGTIRATARGGHPLGLEGSIEWTRNQGLLVRRVGRFIQAPTLYTSDHMKWCDEKGWILVRPN